MYSIRNRDKLIPGDEMINQAIFCGIDADHDIETYLSLTHMNIRAVTF